MSTVSQTKMPLAAADGMGERVGSGPNLFDAVWAVFPLLQRRRLAQESADTEVARFMCYENPTFSLANTVFRNETIRRPSVHPLNRKKNPSAVFP